MRAAPGCPDAPRSRFRAVVCIKTKSVHALAGYGFEEGLCPLPPLCRRSWRRGGYRDACSIARSGARGRVFDTPPRGPFGAPDRPACRPTPCRQLRPRPWPLRSRPARFRGGAQVVRHAPWRPQATTRERRQLRLLSTAWTIGCAGRVAARGRAASPTKRGQNCIASQAIIEKLHFEKGTSQRYPIWMSLGLSDGFAVR
jgi:hypothetical protein